MTRLAAILAALTAFPAVASATARFAVVVGNNEGAPGRPRLWYAEKDADGFARTIRELGGFAEDRVTVLHGASPASLRAAMAAADARVRLARAAGERTLLVFYYSGHAGAAGLELGGERVRFAELREIITRSPAEAKVAIVDACEAGLLTQVKGATATAALDFAVQPDSAAQGTAYITSTAAGESAQESAAIGGSFFTFHLEAALRGAGDSDGDGLVTLAEAFHYTSARTLSGTVATQPGPQHPTYEFHMSGRGDVILAELRRADARLRLPADPGALYVLRDVRGVVAEVPGSASSLSMGLPAGTYSVERRSDRGLATGAVALAKGDDVALPLLSPSRYELARSKGGPRPGLLYTGVGVTWVNLPGFGAALAAGLGLRKEVGPIGLRARVEYASGHVRDGRLEYDYSLLSGTLAALYPLNASRILIEAGPVAGYGYATQRRADQRTFTSGVLIGGAAFMVTAPLGPLRVGVDGMAGAQGFKLNGGNAVRPTISTALLVLYGF